MAMKAKKSILEAHYGAAQDVIAVIAADTSLPSTGFQDPPPGIRDGKAQLEEVKFDEYKSGENAGKPYFQASAVILEPIEHVYTPTSKGKRIGEDVTMTVAGMTTRIQIPMYDITARTGRNMGKVTPWQEQAKKVAQHLRALGIDTSKARTAADLEALAEQLTRVARNPKTPIYLRFSTSVRDAAKEGDADGVWQNWNGTAGLENYVPPGDGVIDVSPNINEQSSPHKTHWSPAPQATPADDDNSLADTSLDELLEAAKADDTSAQDELLRRAAKKTGKTTEDIEGEADSWEAVVNLITGDEPDGDTEQQEAEPWTTFAPKKGDHFNYRPMTKKLGKMVRATKPVECMVTTANTTKQTVTLKSTVDGKTTYPDVPWADLEEPT